MSLEKWKDYLQLLFTRSYLDDHYNSIEPTHNERLAKVWEQNYSLQDPKTMLKCVLNSQRKLHQEMKFSGKIINQGEPNWKMFQVWRSLESKIFGGSFEFINRNKQSFALIWRQLILTTRNKLTPLWFDLIFLFNIKRTILIMNISNSWSAKGIKNIFFA